jgi:hypothetical protein
MCFSKYPEMTPNRTCTSPALGIVDEMQVDVNEENLRVLEDDAERGQPG